MCIVLLWLTTKWRPAVCGRRPMSLVMEFIRLLVWLKQNKHPWRGEAHQKNFTLHKISVDESARIFLANKDWLWKAFCRKDSRRACITKLFWNAGGHSRQNRWNPSDNIALLKNFPPLRCPACRSGFYLPRFPCRIISKNAVLEATLALHWYAPLSRYRPASKCRWVDYGLCVENNLLI